MNDRDIHNPESGAMGPDGNPVLLDFRSQLRQWTECEGLEADLEAGIWTLLGTSLTDDARPSDPRDIIACLRGWDRYQNLKLLGFGGGGAVFEAFDPRLERAVALKFLWGRERSLERATQEARAQARVDHPNIVKMFEVEKVLGMPYLAMQLVEGPPLGALKGRLTPPELVRLLHQAAEGIEAAHRAGLAHLDLKPGNILVDRLDPDHPQALVSDFGLGCSSSGGEATSNRCGTPTFASPEQMGAHASPVGPASDVYGLGATLQAMLGGELPRRSSSDWVPLPPSPPGIDGELAAVIRKATAFEPSYRYRSAKDLAGDLERWMEGKPVHARAGHGLRALLYGLKTRRGLRIAGASAAALALFLGFWGHRVQIRAERTVRLERLYMAEARNLELRASHARTSPCHDVRGELAAIQQRIQALEAHLGSTPEEGQGPLHLAIGRGYLALSKAGPALESLRWAWARGYRTPACASALGQAYAAKYMEEIGRFGYTVSPALKQTRIRAFENYGRPAIELLRTVEAGPGESPAYISALVAFCEMRSREDVLRLARQAIQEAPWLYEASVLEANTLLAEYMDAHGASTLEASEKIFRQASEAYTRASEIGRSDEYVASNALSLALERLTWTLERDSFDLSQMSEAEALVARIRAIRPGPLADLAELKCLALRVYGSVLVGRDPEAAAVKARSLFKALEKDPKYGLEARFQWILIIEVGGLSIPGASRDPEVPYLEAEGILREMVAHDGWTQGDLAEILCRRIQAIRIKGGDPGPLLKRNLPVFERGIRDFEGDYCAPEWIGDAWLDVALASLDRGESPGEALDLALRYFRQAADLGKDAPPPHLRLGLANLAKARWRFRQGEDPGPAIVEATAELEMVLKAQPNRKVARWALGHAHLLQAGVMIRSGLSADAELVRARASLAQVEQRHYSRLLDSGLEARLRLLEAAEALRVGRDPGKFLADAKESLRSELRVHPFLARSRRLLQSMDAAPGGGASLSSETLVHWIE